MTKKNELYKCDVCGNIVEVVGTGAGQLVCCGEPMRLMEAHETDEGFEKHVPVVERTEKGIKVTVGSTPHPMIEEHYITFIEAMADGNVYRTYLKPGQEPVAEFEMEIGEESGLVVREHCNIHGVWKKEGV